MRTLYSIKNTFFAVIGQLISIIVSFVTRTIFIHELGVTILGINGLFTNILSILSFAELGIGTAIIFALYKPFSENDEEMVSALMNFYSKAYKFIGVSIGLLGLLLTPFLNLIVNNEIEIPNIRYYFLLFLLNSVISYFYVYKRAIILVSQKGYIISIYQTIFLILQNIFQILVLVFTKNFILYLIIQIIFNFSLNYSLSKKADLLFPYLSKNKTNKINQIEKRRISKNVISMISNKLGSVAVSGSGNILLSLFVGINWVGIYSNYILITSTITLLISQIFNALTASVGNLNAIEDSEKSYKVFNTLFFLNIWFFSVISVILYILLNPAIQLWLGDKFTLGSFSVFLIVINFFLYGSRQTSIIFINTFGLFWEIKIKSIIEAIINISVSLILLSYFKLGINGILLGVTISTLFTNIWWEPYVLYKYAFNKSFFLYLRKYLLYFINVLLILLLMDISKTFFSLSLVNNIIIRVIIGLILSNIIFIINISAIKELINVINVLKFSFQNSKIN